MRVWRRKAVAVVLVLGACLGVVVTRAVWEGRAALARGDRAAAASDTAAAIRWWRRAARWYVPGAPYVREAYDRLQALAVSSEKAGRTGTALAAWQGIRRSILATRSLYRPFAARLEPANRHIAALMARKEGPGADPARSESERADWHYRLLAADRTPSVWWSIVALLGFATWLGGGLLFATRGVTDGDGDAIVARTAAIAGLLVAGGLVMWMLGLYKA